MNDMDKDIFFWDKLARHYDRIIAGDEKRYKQMIKWMIECVKPKDCVLEVATGTGKIALALCEVTEKVEACDISSEMLSIANQRALEREYNNINFRLQDACVLTYQCESFDVVVISNALHIMPNPKEALSRIHKVLKNDGLLIAPTFLHGETWLSRIASRIMSFSGFKAYNKWSEKNFIKFIEESGYTVVEKRRLSGILPLLYIVAGKKGI